jgi:hypothetical protein
VVAYEQVVHNREPKSTAGTYFSGSAFLLRRVAIWSLLLGRLLRFDLSGFKDIIRQIRPKDVISESSYSGERCTRAPRRERAAYARRCVMLKLLNSALNSFHP